MKRYSDRPAGNLAVQARARDDDSSQNKQQYIDYVQNLRLQARQSTKDAQSARRTARREQTQEWWDESLDDLKEYVNDCLPDYYASEDFELESVYGELRRCTATTRAGFLAWVFKQIAKSPHFHLAMDAIEQFDEDISNFIDDATLRHERYTNFPEYVKNGSVYLINMGGTGVPIVWSVPEELWGFVQRAWPVQLKGKPDGYSIVKKIHGVTVNVHRLVVACELGDVVLSHSPAGLLDWTSLYVRPFNGSKGRRSQAEFEKHFKSMPALENHGVDVDGSRFIIAKPVPVNKNLGQQAGANGKAGKIGWVKSILPFEDTYAPDKYCESIKQAAKNLRATKAPKTLNERIASQKLDELGL
jgi:hypothetical protein